MENLKIRVNSADESKEAQELFFKLGFQWRGLKSPFDLFYPTSMDNYYIVLTKGSKEMQIAGAFRDGLRAWKEITLPELRAMAYPMKEYLDANRNYEFVLSTEKDDGFIEIPEGAEVATICRNYIIFWKDEEYSFSVSEENKWCYKSCDDSKYFSLGEYMNEYGDVSVIWQRATHPEELPFIDDEPKYTDDEVRYMDENGQGRLQSINDQYAEIEQVRRVEIHSTVKATQASGGVDATLTERQSQYGCYEDVAHVTQEILKALRISGYDRMPATHKESMHMIASKMARLVCGDCNSIDGWHDISGYATLVERLIGDQSDV